MDTPSEPARPSVLDRLKAAKEKADKLVSTTLPVSGIAVTYPGFVSHDKVMAATKLAGKDRQRVGLILVAQTCLFEGERLTVDEIGASLHNRDAVHMINRVLGADDSGDGEGN